MVTHTQPPLVAAARASGLFAYRTDSSIAQRCLRTLRVNSKTSVSCAGLLSELLSKAIRRLERSPQKARFRYKKLEPTFGFEPKTCCLRNSCSTTELRWPRAAIVRNRLFERQRAAGGLDLDVLDLRHRRPQQLSRNHLDAVSVAGGVEAKAWGSVAGERVALLEELTDSARDGP